ncbi:MAG: PilW family protein [Ramlibacter sp.]|nr:PilW family protein [Ramlibacter sp.]
MMKRTSFTHGSSLRARGSRGISLVELMVTIAIGMLIVAAMAILFANNSRSRAELEKTSQKIENGRYALDVMAADIQNAGYFAEFEPRVLTMPTDKPDACATDVASLTAALRVHVQGNNDVAASTLSCLSDVKPGTDVLVIRRVSGCVAGVAGCTALAAGDVRFQASSCNSATELGSGAVADSFRLDTSTSTLTLTRRDCTTVADVRRFLVRIYYIGNNDKAGDGIPTLKRAELTGGAFVPVSLVQGVENMQIEYGLDTDGDGAPDVYTPAPDSYLACTNATSPTCAQHWASVMTAKVSLLSRNVESTAGYVDAKSYVVGRKPDGAGAISGTDNVIGPMNDAFKRSVFETVIRFQNPAGRASS